VKVSVMGGGPAGLFFALLLKRADPSHQVTVLERNRRDETWGFGVVFSDATEEALAHAEAIAARVGLAAQLDKLAANLTVAGRKRLELARALATGPKLLLLDEVLAGLNPQEIAEVLPVVRAIRESGVTVFMIEHVMQAVMNLADTVFVLNEGRLIAEGPPAQIAGDVRVIEAYLGHGAAERLRRAALATSVAASGDAHA